MLCLILPPAHGPSLVDLSQNRSFPPSGTRVAIGEGRAGTGCEAGACRLPPTGDENGSRAARGARVAQRREPEADRHVAKRHRGRAPEREGQDVLVARSAPRPRGRVRGGRAPRRRAVVLRGAGNASTVVASALEQAIAERDEATASRGSSGRRPTPAYAGEGGRPSSMWCERRRRPNPLHSPRPFERAGRRAGGRQRSTSRDHGPRGLIARRECEMVA